MYEHDARGNEETLSEGCIIQIDLKKTIIFV